jgi:hypothetical protein
MTLYIIQTQIVQQSEYTIEYNNKTQNLRNLTSQ